MRAKLKFTLITSRYHILPLQYLKLLLVFSNQGSRGSKPIAIKENQFLTFSSVLIRLPTVKMQFKIILLFGVALLTGLEADAERKILVVFPKLEIQSLQSFKENSSAIGWAESPLSGLTQTSARTLSTAFSESIRKANSITCIDQKATQLE